MVEKVEPKQVRGKKPRVQTEPQKTQKTPIEDPRPLFEKCRYDTGLAKDIELGKRLEARKDYITIIPPDGPFLRIKDVIVSDNGLLIHAGDIMKP